MTLQQLNYLAEIVNRGSINKAARSLFVSQSSLSTSLRELEEEVGVTIFLRNNKGVELTNEGRAFYDQILPMLEQEKRVLKLYAGKGGPSSFRLHISSQHFPFVSRAFVRLMEKIKDKDYDLHLKETNIHHVIDDISSGEGDIGLLYTSNTTQQFLNKIFDNRGLEFHPLKTVFPHVYLRAGHPLAKKESVNTRDLKEYPYAVFNLERTLSFNFSEEVVLSDFDPPNCTIHFNDRGTMFDILAHTDAFSIGSGLLSKEFCSTNITTVPLSGPDTVYVGWLYPQNRPLKEPAKLFLALLEESLANDVD